MDIRKVMFMVRVIRSGIEIYEELFDVGFIEDDIFYVFVKLFFVELVIF